MQIRTTFTAILLLICGSVSAQFMTIELAHEIPLSGFVAPVSQNGTLTFRGCPDCKTFSSRLTPSTIFLVNEIQVELSEFRQKVAAARSQDNHGVVVVQHLETNTVTSILIKI